MCANQLINRASVIDRAQHRGTVGHFVWSDSCYWSLQSCSRLNPPWWPKNKTCRPKTLRPLDAFKHYREIEMKAAQWHRVTLCCCAEVWRLVVSQVKLLMCDVCLSGDSSLSITAQNEWITELWGHPTSGTHFHLRAKCRSELWQDRQAESRESILLCFGGETPSTVLQ